MDVRRLGSTRTSRRGFVRFDRDAYTAALESGTEIGDEGVEEAIELVTEVADR